MHAYDDPENPEFDPDAEIRWSRMDNVARIMALSETARLKKQKESGKESVDPTNVASAPAASAASTTSSE